MTALEIIISLCIALGGFSIFMYGIQIMSKALEDLAQSRLKTFFNKSVNNRFIGFGAGVGITAVTQSSSAVTVMLVGFVNAGLMTLMQAAAFIIGANVGSTITFQIVSLSSFNMSAVFALASVIGLFFNMFSQNIKLKNMGLVFLGLGMLFAGLDIMGAQLIKFRSLQWFSGFFVQFDNPLFLIFAGIVFAAVIQSSTATTTVLVSFVAVGGNCGMTILSAFYAVLGINIGTCLTALIAGIGANANAKRTAMIHLLFNALSAVIMLPIMLAGGKYVVWFFELISGENPARQLANFHTLYNIFTALILLPFLGLIVKLSEKLIKDKEPKEILN